MLERELNNIDILCIQEHWLHEHNLHILQDASPNHHVISKSSENLTNLNIIHGGRGKGGVAIYLRKSIISDFKRITCQSSRILAVEITFLQTLKRMLLINCYLPSGTNSSDLAEYQICLGIIGHLLDTHLPPGEQSTGVIAGDLNVDTVNQNTKKSLEYLRQLMISWSLLSVTEAVCSREQYTFSSDDRKKKSNIDGFLVPAAGISQFENLTISEEEPLNTSDHYLVTTEYRLPQSYPLPKNSEMANHRAKKSSRIKIKWEQVNNKEVRELYTCPLELKAFELFKQTLDCELNESEAELLLQDFSLSMLTQSKELPNSIPSRKKRGKPEWTKQVAEAYQNALQGWKRWKRAGKPKNNSTHADYYKHKKEFRRKLRQSRAQEHRNLLSCIESASSANTKLFHHLIKKQRPERSKKLQTDMIHYKGQTFQGNAMSEGWKHYFEDLALTSQEPKLDQPSAQMSQQYHTLLMSSAPTMLITSQEMDEAIRGLKKGKASGPDDITTEHIQNLGEMAKRLILLIFNVLLTKAHTPLSLQKGLVIPIHKGKGKSTQEPKNYRGITLTSTLCKLMEMVLKPHLERSLLQNNIPDELQFGFRKHHSCLLTSSCVELIIEINYANKQPTFVALLDAEKAFDKVWHAGLFQKLTSTSIHPQHLNMVRSLYNNMQSQVLWDGTVSDPFPILQGVRQGGVLSPLLYITFIDELMKILRNKDLGCKLLGRYSGLVVLADDVALLSSSPSELQAMLDVVDSYTKRWRYKINPSKSCVITFNNKGKNMSQPPLWKLGHDTVPSVLQHPHLGIIKSSIKRNSAEDIISKGVRTFYALTGSGAYTGGLLPQHSVSLWKVYCIPRMLYGSAVEKITKGMSARLDQAQHQLFKKILGLPRTAADDAIYLLLGLMPLSNQVDIEKLQMIGQTLDLPHERFEYRTFLHALTKSTLSINSWQAILMKYRLPDLHTLIQHPIPYTLWKKKSKRAVMDVVNDNILQAIEKKSSLSLWRNMPIPDPMLLYPQTSSSQFLRQAIIIRSQLACNTYLTQTRLVTIKKATSTTCRLCHQEDEDNIHFVASCSILASHRSDFIGEMQSRHFSETTLSYFNFNDGFAFTKAILLPNHLMLPSNLYDRLNTLILLFLHKIHIARTSILSSPT